MPSKTQKTQKTPASQTEAKKPAADDANKSSVKDLFTRKSSSKVSAQRNTGAINEPNTSLASGLAVTDCGSASAHHHHPVIIGGGDGGGFSGGGDGGGGFSGGGDGGGGGVSC